MKLLTTSNPKTLKGEAQGYLTAILHLAPASLSGRNVCPWSTPGCRAACLNTAGHGSIKGGPVQKARLERTRLWWADRAGFIAQLDREISHHEARALRLGLKPTVRLNGTSDIPWENVAPNLFTDHAQVQFYDYTRSYQRTLVWIAGRAPSNLHLTYSRKEGTPDDLIRHATGRGISVAVPYSGSLQHFAEYACKHWRIGFPAQVIDGDASDLRFLDPPGSIVALKAKGRAKEDRTGFVVHC